MRTLAIVCFCLCLIAAITPAVSADWVTVDPLLTWAYSEYSGHVSDYASDGNDITYWQNNIAGNELNSRYIITDTNYTYSGVKWKKFSTDTARYIRLVCMYSPTQYYYLSTETTVTAAGTYTITSNNGTCGGPAIPTQHIGVVYTNTGGGWDIVNETQWYQGNYTADSELVVDFNATPTEGVSPLFSAFQDKSTGGVGTKTYNWTVDPPNGLIGNDSTSEYPTIAFTQEGNYSITHCVADSSGQSGCKTETDYIHVYLSNTTISTTFWAVDPLGHRVWDSEITLLNTNTNTWTNTSSPSGGVATISSLVGHVINGYATAAGYNDGETLGITADGVSGGIILMTPTNITNVSAGYVTLYVYAKESVGNAPISGAYINLAYEEGGSTRNDGSTTNTEGVASFVVPNNTLIYVYGEKAGYERVSTTKDSGPGSGGDAAVSVIMYMTEQTVTPTITATTGPGGTVPVTVDPRTPQEKESDIALILIDYGDMLVMFFIALTVIGGVKMITK